MSASLRRLMLITDLGLLTYWSLTALAAAGVVALPPAWLFSDYHSPLVVAWNWSFFPLDMLLSVAGLASVRLAVRNDARWQHYAIISLSLTACAGLMAISFWLIRGEFDPVWWSFNFFLMLWPLPFLLAGISLTPTMPHPARGG
ncbi:MAG: DUF5360 family protein [Alphaproteobacteria bacterium]